MIKTAQLLKEHDFLIKKKYGQNFLTDHNIINKIIDGACLTKDHTVLEIGPGLGALTSGLSQRVKQVICIEIDKNLIPILESHEFANVDILEGDILKVDVKSLISDKTPVSIVANLPYYISTPIITNLLILDDIVDSITIMIQKEVADRLVAQPGTKAYGSLTVFVSYHADVNHVITVPPGCFIPRPAVDSSVIHLKINKKRKPTNEDFFYKLVRQSFSQRRKTLINSLTNKSNEIGLTKEQIQQGFKELGINENIRGEVLSLDDFLNLSDELCKFL